APSSTKAPTPSSSTRSTKQLEVAPRVARRWSSWPPARPRRLRGVRLGAPRTEWRVVSQPPARPRRLRRLRAVDLPQTRARLRSVDRVHVGTVRTALRRRLRASGGGIRRAPRAQHREGSLMHAGPTRGTALQSRCDEGRVTRPIDDDVLPGSRITCPNHATPSDEGG